MLYAALRKRHYWPGMPACYRLRPLIERMATMPVTSRYLRLALYTVLILMGAAVVGSWAMQQAKQQALVESARRGPEQLNLYANSLHTLIERYRALPAVLAQDPELISALAGPVTADIQTQLNRKLERINGAALGAIRAPAGYKQHRGGGHTGQAEIGHRENPLVCE